MEKKLEFRSLIKMFSVRSRYTSTNFLNKLEKMRHNSTDLMQN